MQDLNQRPVLPFADASLDAVVCTASMNTYPPQVVLAKRCAYCGRAGVFVTTFSNRWFPTKAIQAWGELHEFERVGLVTQWLQQADFDRLHTFSCRGWPRPENDLHYAETAVSDPVYAVWGFKPEVVDPDLVQ